MDFNTIFTGMNFKSCFVVPPEKQKQETVKETAKKTDKILKPTSCPIADPAQIDDVTLLRFPPRPTLQSRSSSEILHSDFLNLPAPAIGHEVGFKRKNNKTKG